MSAAARVAAERPGLALAAWLVMLERSSGAGRVGVRHGGAWLELDIAAIDTVASLLTRIEALVNAGSLAGVGAEAAGPEAEAEVIWLAPGLSMDEAAASPSAWLAGALSPDGAQLVVHWRTPPVDPDAGRLLASAWHEVIEQLATAAPQTALEQIEAMGAAARQRQLRALDAGPWSHESRQGPLAVTECFERVLAAGPDRRALAWNGGACTYAELDALSRRIAGALQGAGIGAGNIVAVGLPRSPKGIAALLGVLRIGAAYLPVDLEHPPERLRFMFADSQARALVGTGVGDEFLGLRCIDVERLPEATACGAARPASPPPDGDALAYVMYTSGSTGQPKGVEIRHRSIVRLVCGAEFMRLDRDVVMLHAAPLGFDASTLEVWGPLLNGGCCVVHDEVVPSGPGLAATIGAHGVQAAWLTAALFNAVVDDDPRHLAGLRELLIGGEALSLDHVRRFHAAVPGTQLINGYGPTETTTFAATHRIDVPALAGAKSVPIGRPITRTSLYILNRRGRPVPDGLVGELLIGGLGVGRGYLARPELTAERFLPDPFAAERGEVGTMYRTGDLVRLLPDDTVEFIGRADGQVKVRGFRIELGEIETALAAHHSVKACAVLARRDPQRGAELVAYVVAKPGEAGDAFAPAVLREHLASQLPEFMVPALWVRLQALPVTGNGKLDRRALPEPAHERPEHLAQHYVQPRAGLESEIAAAFGAALDIARIGALDNFFELGGSSLLIMRVFSALRAAGHTRLNVAMLFADATPRGLAKALADAGAPVPPRPARQAPALGRTEAEPVAIVGMAGRFPGARDIEAFWQMLDEGREAIRFFSEEELDASIPAALRTDAQYVRARGVVDDVDLFDAGFFGINPREAELMDPQQRVFLELAWECLERTGQVPEKTPAPIGVWCGMYNATYFQRHVLAHPDKIARVGEFQVMLANEKDYIATRTAHRLGLTGPAVSVHTACSTSLVAIAMAFDALRAGHCGLALAGGSSITCPPMSGYLYQDGAMLSPDGHTRSFDADAQGTVFSDGAAVVALKRLSDAIADGNTIHAVIRGVGINNDGADKASFTAPSVSGQAAVIASALDHAGVDARSLSYVETHGTATPLGDPVEVAALTQAFRRHTSDTGFCAIGSLKSNTGHMVIAAGAAGVIKTAMALQHERLPASINFTRPNPKIELEGGPFVVQSTRGAWPRSAAPRRAGVSAFGVGGTNAHVVLEEAPLPAARAPAEGPQLLRLSARSAGALQSGMHRLADFLERSPGTDLADAAHTLEVGRREFAHRSYVVADSTAAAVAALRSADGAKARARSLPRAEPSIVFAFPGQGAQYAGMGRQLHGRLPAFRAAFDECLAALEGHVDFDARAVFFGDDEARLAQTEVTQPATFCLEYALAREWLARGLEPAALVGHSIGEFVAAVLAGVMPLEHAVRLVARRGALMQALPAGAMLSVRLAAGELAPLLPPGVQLAAENGPTASVVAGPLPAIDALAAALQARGVVARRLVTSHAFHSAMMQPALPAFEAAVRAVPLAAPRQRIASTATGAWLTEAEATDPAHWARQLREPVRFSPAVTLLLQEVSSPLFVECGPRATLCALIRQHRQGGAVPQAVPSLGDESSRELATLADAAGALWVQGAAVAASMSPAAPRRRIVLPTYAFERQRHWVDARTESPPLGSPAPVESHAGAAAADNAMTKGEETSAATHALHAPQAPQAPQAEPAVPIESPVISNTPETPTTTMTATTQAAGRLNALHQRLRSVFEDVSGYELADADGEASFVELGLDSLTLTQVAMQLKKEFALNITFRQLMESLRSFDALAEHLDATLPAEAVAPAPAVAPAVATAPTAIPAGPMPAAAALPAMAMPAFTQPAGASTPLVQQVIQQQMLLMAQQLALLQGQPAAALPTVTAPAVAQPVAQPAVQPAAQRATEPAAAAGKPAAPADEEGALTHRTYDVKKAFGAIARIHTAGTEMSERQRARLDAFMRRYIQKTKRSKEYTVQHRPHLADPRVVNGFRPQLKEIIYQIVIERSKGSRMWDIDGNEYVDALNGFGMSLFGWQPDFVLDAVRKQLDGGYDIGPQHPLAGEVAQLMCKLTGFDRAGLCNTGSEAVMGCVRIARTVTGRSKIAIFAGAYHGIFDEVIVRGTKKLKSVPAAPGILPNTAENVVVLDYGTPETLQWLKDNAKDLAAILVEPVQSRRPDFQPREFLRELRTLTEQSGALLIFDEVVTGFRCHPGGIQALFGIRADLGSYGKVVGGGFPIGVIAGKREYMDALDGGHWEYGDDSIPTVGVTYFAGTFVRHPLALVAAKAVLEHLDHEGPELQATLTRSTAAMVDELNAFCREVGAPIVLKHFSSVWKIFFNEDHPLQDLLFAMMRNRCVHVLDNFPCFMTTAHTAQDIAVIKTAFKEAVAELQEADFIPRRVSAAAVEFDASRPPVPGARLGRDAEGKPAWFVANPQAPGKYIKVDVQ
ncbi:MAG: amino acid adenylation domain-containing protein [Burkholderiales bacterium]|nr:amino acid adenylation domain-containing protein [Burkholderiales bacterium]